jgi:hypothetical protein
MTITEGQDYNEHYRFEVALEEEKDNLFELRGRFDCSSK